MIKANEVRAGNFILNDNKIEKVTGELIAAIEKFGNMQWKTIPPKDVLNPIQLTREILKKCGFVEDDSGIYENRFYIHKEGDEWFIIDKQENGYAVFASEWTIGKPFQYLHQLQNLYYALTGEELQVNLTEPVLN